MSIDYVVNLIMVQKIISEKSQRGCIINSIQKFKKLTGAKLDVGGNKYHKERTVIRENDFFG